MAFLFDNQRLSIDLLATMSGPSTFPIDQLRHPSDLSIWIESAGVVSDADRLDTPHLIRAKQLRHAIAEVLRAAQRGGQPGLGESAHHLNKAASRPRPQLRLDGRAVIRTGGFDAFVAEAATDALDLLSCPERLREVRWCSIPGCRRAFLDRSPAGQQRWCSARCRTQFNSGGYRQRQRQEDRSVRARRSAFH